MRNLGLVSCRGDGWESCVVVLSAVQLPEHGIRMANNLTISHCTSHENLNGQPAFTSNDGCGFDLDGGVTNSVVRYQILDGLLGKYDPTTVTIVLRRLSILSPSGMPALDFSFATLAHRL